MDSIIFSPCYLYPLRQIRCSSKCGINLYLAHSNTRVYHRKITKNLRYPRRTKLPPDDTFLRKKKSPVDDEIPMAERRLVFDFGEEVSETPCDDYHNANAAASDNDGGTKDDMNVEQDNDVDWSSDEIEAISSLFQGRIPQKPGNLNRERPLPLPLPYKIRPLRLPTPKNITLSSRKSVSGQLYKTSNFLIQLAKEIRSLPPDEDASVVLNNYARFIRKGSLSITIRELGHMDLPDRALQIFCWAQKQTLLFPDDRILASTVEVLAKSRDLKMPFNLENFTAMASKNVYEAMIRGLIKGGNLKLSWKLLSDARNGNRVLDASIYAKLILELGKNPDKYVLVTELLDKLGEREDLNLIQQDCTAIMKICIRLEKFEIVESLFNWFKQSGGEPSIVMYTTVVHSRYSDEKYREALALVWEMEGLSCLLDLPAYHVVIRLFVALKDVSRAARYFSKLKVAGFSPTFGIYRDMIKVYVESGRLAKFKEVCREAETAGFKLDKETRGEFGTTYLCTDLESGEKIACKLISKKKLWTSVDIDDVKREVEIMKHMHKHPNIVSLKDTYEDETAGYIVMESGERGELFGQIVARGHYTERAAAGVMRTIMEVVQTSHMNGVMHRDLKSEYFLFSNKKETAALKASNFGLSVFFKPGEPYDVWSAGVILHTYAVHTAPMRLQVE